jgi:predicted P-loop ATPase
MIPTKENGQVTALTATCPEIAFQAGKTRTVSHVAFIDTTPADWKLDQQTNTDGSLDCRASINFRLALTHFPAMAGKLRRNWFTDKIEIGAVPWNGDGRSRPLCDRDIVRGREWLQVSGFKLTKVEAHDALIEAAEAQGYDPLEDYLNGLEWDRNPRVDRWLVDYFGCNDTPLHIQFARCTLIGAVARALNPGCKHDTLLILEGAQGVGKSRGVRAMVPVEKWFSDCLSLSAEPREMVEASAGKWIIEASELGGHHKAHVDALKATLSRREDTARGAYKAVPADKPRRFLLIGTHNPKAGGTFDDPTGGRRFWPVTVGNVDVDAIERDRDQLWAEAVARYRAGEQNWLAPQFEAAAADAVEERTKVDPLVDAFTKSWDQIPDEVTAYGALEHAGYDASHRTQTLVQRAAMALKTLGFIKLNKRGSGSAMWRKPY